MQKIRIVAVGSIKEKFFTDAIAEYKKRLSRFCEFEIIEVPEKANLPQSQKIVEESKLLLEKCKGKLILFDRAGSDTSSEQLATLLKANQEEPLLTFVIGGSNGVSENLKKAAYKTIKFGNLTFPHQLFRVVAVEQIYRAETINNNLPYHK